MQGSSSADVVDIGDIYKRSESPTDFYVAIKSLSSFQKYNLLINHKKTLINISNFLRLTLVAVIVVSGRFGLTNTLGWCIVSQWMVCFAFIVLRLSQG